MAPEGNGRGETVLHADVGSLARATGTADGRHVGILSDHSVQEWQRRIDSTPSPTDDRHFLKLGGKLRSTAAASSGGVQTRPMGPNLDVTVVEEATPDDLERALDAALGDTDDGVLAVEDPSFVFDDADDPGERLDAFIEMATDRCATVHARVPNEPRAITTLARRFDFADDRCRRWIAETGVTQLREDDPTNFGYLRSNWREARRGLEAVDMVYPQSKQIHDAIPNPDTTPRTLGAALQAFVELGALGVWGDTVAANRYDMTGYDPEMVAAIGRAVEELHEK
ncbi:MAG: hypothetical protein ABEH80_08590 [Halobaculum sp.]